MEIEIKAVVLAAGKSKRMKSAYSKVVHRILGKEIVNYLLDSIVKVGIKEENIVVVLGEKAGDVRSAIKRPVRYACQAEQLGTAHALLSARQAFENFTGHLLVTVGDNPYITAGELTRLIDLHRRTQSACTFISAIFPSTPPPYGRIIRDSQGRVIDVVEEIDAGPEELAIREVNASIYLFHVPTVLPLLPLIDNRNEKGEYYLTDIIKLLHDRGQAIETVRAADPAISIGINTRWELAQAQERFNRENLRRLAEEDGVTILQPDSVTVEWDVEIGRDTVIYPAVYLAAGTKIGKNCRIGPFAYLKEVVVPDDREIAFEKRTGS